MNKTASDSCVHDSQLKVNLLVPKSLSESAHRLIDSLAVMQGQGVFGKANVAFASETGSEEGLRLSYGSAESSLLFLPLSDEGDERAHAYYANEAHLLYLLVEQLHIALDCENNVCQTTIEGDDLLLGESRLPMRDLPFLAQMDRRSLDEVLMALMQSMKLASLRGQSRSARAALAMRLADAGRIKEALASLGELRGQATGELILSVDLSPLEGSRPLEQRLERTYECYREFFARAEVYPVETHMLAKMQFNCALICRHCSRLLLAIQHARRAVEYYRALEAQRADLADALRNLGYFYREIDQYDKALEYYTDSLKLYEELSQQDAQAHLAQLLIINDELAELACAREQFGDAEKHYLACLQLVEQQRASGLENSEVELRLIKVLAHAQKLCKKLTWAEKSYRHALKLHERLCSRDEDHHEFLADQADTLMLLGNLLEERNKQREAEESYQRGIAIYERLAAVASAEIQPYWAMSLYNLADLYLTQNKYRKAEKLLLRSQHMLESLPEPPPAELAMVVDTLGILYSLRKKHKRAIPLLQQACQIREDVGLAPWCHSMGNLTEAYRVSKQPEKAIRTLRRSCERMEQALEAGDSSCLEFLASSMMRLGDLEKERKNDIEARLAWVRSLELYELLGSRYADVRNFLRDCIEPPYESFFAKSWRVSVSLFLGALASLIVGLFVFNIGRNLWKLIEHFL